MRKQPAMVTVSLRLPRDLHKDLTALAKGTEQSMNRLIRETMRERIAQEGSR